MTNHSGPFFISAAAVAQALRLEDAIAAIRAGYSVPIPDVAAPPRLLARGEGVWLRCLAAVPPSTGVMGSKVFGLGSARTVNYLISLFDQASAKLLGLVDGCEITAIRTAATSAVAIEELAPRRPLVAAILGSGLEAQTHLRALALVRALTEVRIYSPTPANRAKFAQQASNDLGLNAVPAISPAAAVEGADIVIAAARSYDEKPILQAEWLKQDVMIVSIGSTLPEQREVDVSIIAAADLIVCDSVEEVDGHSGDMLAAKAAGVDVSAKLLSLNDLLCGRDGGKAAAARRPLFKSVGSAIQDILVADLVFKQALERGLATPLDLPLYTKQV